MKKNSIHFCSFTIVLLLLTTCTNRDFKPTSQTTTTPNYGSHGIKTELIEIENYKDIIYVSSANKDSIGNGSKNNPFHSVHSALNKAIKIKTDDRIGIFVAEGEYNEATIKMIPKVDLYGGFNMFNWDRNIGTYKTIINAEGKNRVIEGANESKIDGFVISGGKIRGTGAGINCSGVSPIISNNFFINNQTLGPTDWNPKYWHETANNGGAIYCEDGSRAIIRNCMFLNNTTENGRGGGIAADNKCKLLITENVFINNITGTKDPMRSSDGGAISIFNWCHAKITHNVFLSNKALNRNDAGGVFIALWSSAHVDGNIFVNNVAGDDAGGLFVGGQEHRYGGVPLDPIPATKDFSVNVSNNLFLGNKNSSFNSGVMRFTMESKGSYTNNISALNNGIYFQRSEVSVKENTILDNFLFIETKTGLLPGEIKNNLIWADFTLDVKPEVSGNIIKGELDSLGEQFQAPKFVNDGSIFSVISLNINKKALKTEALIDGSNFKKNSLVNRVVRSGDKWGVIKSNSQTEITIWGNLYGAETIQLLPTYTQIK